MIAKVKLSKNPSNLIDYILGDKVNGKQDRAILLESNYCFGDKADLKKQFLEAIGDSKLKSHAMHIIVSMPPDERLNEYQKSELMQSISEKMNLGDYPFLFVEHLDTANHQHFHIAVARKSYGHNKTLSDSNSYAKLMNVMRQLEKKWSLREVPLHSNNDSRKQKMKMDIELSLNHAKTIEQFRGEMFLKGYSIKIGRGISFTDSKGMVCKGSHPAINYSLSTIKKILAENNSTAQLINIPIVKKDNASSPNSINGNLNENSNQSMTLTIPNTTSNSQPEQEEDLKFKRKRKFKIKR